jgi:peptidoglycan DL-endopeptidase CwlO
MGARRTIPTVAAMAVVCACAVVGAPGVAFAGPSAHVMSPGPPSPPGSGAAGTADGAGRAKTTGRAGTPGGTGADDARLQKVRARLDKLYHDAAVATDAYDAAEEKAGRQSKALAELTGRITGTRRKLTGLRDRAGAAARSQYRSGGLPPEARLWLSDDPQAFLENTERMREGQHAAKGLITDTQRAEKDLEKYHRDAAGRLKKLEADRKAKAAARKETEKQIHAAERLESQLAKKQKERLAALEEQAAREAQTAWLNSGALKDLGREATGTAKEAVRFATAQIGKPYVWGAEGPTSYDCSGLTSQAWASAGRPIPRTSQEQWRLLPHVPVDEMRPGDLIIYFDDASHVGMYVGDGTVVHAPRPGRSVTTTGAGTMPILGVVRP